MRLPTAVPAGWPGGPRAGLLGHAPELRRDALGFLRHARAAYGDVFTLRFGPRPVLMVAGPAAAREVLVEHGAQFRKGRGIQKMRDFLGGGLLTAEGEAWRQHRRLMQPAFHRAALGHLAAGIVEAAQPTLRQLGAASRSGAELEVGAEMLRVALRAVAAALFGTGLSERELAVVERELPPLLERTAARVRAVVDLPAHWPTPANLRARAAGAALDAVVARIIAGRRARPEPGSDLLGLLIGARDEAGAGLSDTEVRDEVMTLFLAGHETTATLLTFLWLNLARRPDLQARVRAEVRGVLGGRDPEADDLGQLPLLHACIQETLRLYPPAWIVPRQATAPVTVAGVALEPGALVSVNIFLIQRHAHHWPEPDEFQPERHAAGARAPEAFLPFGAGARMCIGTHLALMEAGLIAALILRDFTLEVPGGGPRGLSAGVTLKPAGAVRARVTAA